MSDPGPQTERTRFPLLPSPVELNVASFLAGILLPGICFMLAAAGVPEAPTWQSGRYDAYVSFLLSGETSWVFYPFLVYSVASLLFVLFLPQQASRYFVVRVGIYSGVVLALQYAYVLGVVVLDVGDMSHWRSIGVTLLGIPLISLMALAAPAVGWLILWGMVRLYQRYPLVIAMLLGTLLVLGVATCAAIVVADVLGNELGESLGPVVSAPIAIVCLGSLVSAPTWAAAVYAYQSIRIMRLHGGRFQLRLWQLLGIFTWIAAYLAAWRVAVRLVLEAYSQLPVEEPGDCYLATAAAQGHPRWVGSHEVRCRSGAMRRVNLQLAYFKCGELALMAVAPPLHRAIRRVYDVLGRRAALQLAHPLTADVAYLTLKPLEWVTRLSLAALIGDIRPMARRMYG